MSYLSNLLLTKPTTDLNTAVRRMHITEFMVKLLIALSCLIMTVHVAAVITGCNTPYAEAICGYSVFGFILLALAAWVFHLCWLSWLMIIYVHLVQQCIILQRYGFFDGFLYYERFVLLVMGCSLSLNLLFNYHNYFSLFKR